MGRTRVFLTSKGKQMVWSTRRPYGGSLPLISYWQGNDLVIQTIRDETTIYNQGKINVKRVLTMSADKKMITECRIGTATDGSQSSSAAIWDRQ
jgi:hypothetical protein